MATGAESRLRSFVLVGPGRLGLRLALRLVRCGHHCVCVRGRRPVAAEHRPEFGAAAVWDTWSEPRAWPCPDLVFVCVPDRMIAEVAHDLAGERQIAGAVVLHTSGLLGAQELAPCRSVAAALGSWHPLQSFPPLAAGEVHWQRVSCAVEGDGAAVEAGFEIAERLGLRPWRIESHHKHRYHAAAAVAGNLVHILVSEAARAMRECGLDGLQAAAALEPMVVLSVRAALAARGLESLTGPIARGDRETIDRHLQSLPPPLDEVYSRLVSLALERMSQQRIEPTDGAANRN